jgi:hypothetical protein
MPKLIKGNERPKQSFGKQLNYNLIFVKAIEEQQAQSDQYRE